MAQSVAPVSGDTVDHSHDHPSDGQYIRLAIYLTIITIIEVAIYYVDWMHESGVLVPTLIVLSAAKFITVIAYYMHLKFDDPRYRFIFLSSLFVALAVFAAVIVLLAVNQIAYALDFL